MKIAMIGHKRIPSREGGIEVVVEALAVRMAAMGHEVDCYNRAAHGDGERVRMYKGVRLIKVPTLKTPPFNAGLYSLVAVLQAVMEKYDVIHLHAEGPGAMTFLPKLFHIPVVCTIHGLDWQRVKWGAIASRYLLWGEKCAARLSDALIVLSHSAKMYFNAEYGKEAICIPNGVDIRPYRPAQVIHRRWGLQKDGYILFLARLTPEKGVHSLIEAYRGIDTKKRLVIAGAKTPENEYIKRICRMAAEDERIVMTDFVQGRTLEELMGNAYLYVLPSDVEGMALSLLEALSYGVRCLISDIDENRDAAKEYAQFFKRGDIQTLRIQIEKALDAEKEKHDRAKQIAFVKERYNWDDVTAQTLDAYEYACAHAGRRGND